MAKDAPNKTCATENSVAEFLAGIPDDERRSDAEQLVELMGKITGKAPMMWGSSIIGFDQYHYKYESGREGDWAAAAFSPRKSSLTIYFADGLSRHSELLDQLGTHKTGKGCLYIKRLSDVNRDVLAKLIEESYQYVMSHKSDMHRA
jgi:hypothetical protein